MSGWTFIAGAVPIDDKTSKAYDKQIRDHVSKRDCGRAEGLIREVESKDKYYQFLPEWYHLMISCQRSVRRDGSEFEMKIFEFFDHHLDLRIKQSCAEAEKYLNSIDKKYHTNWGVARWQYKVAHCFERTDSKKSQALYQMIVRDFPDRREAADASQRLTLFTPTQRRWIFPRSQTVIDGVRKGLREKDVEILASFASQSSFNRRFGENTEAISFERDMKMELKEKLARSDVIIPPLEPAAKDLFLLPVIFAKEEFPFWKFVFQNVDGGWQWVGVHISPAKDQGKKTD